MNTFKQNFKKLFVTTYQLNKFFIVTNIIIIEVVVIVIIITTTILGLITSFLVFFNFWNMSCLREHNKNKTFLLVLCHPCQKDSIFVYSDQLICIVFNTAFVFFLLSSCSGTLKDDCFESSRKLRGKMVVCIFIRNWPY